MMRPYEHHFLEIIPYFHVACPPLNPACGDGKGGGVKNVSQTMTGLHKPFPPHPPTVMSTSSASSPGPGSASPSSYQS